MSCPSLTALSSSSYKDGNKNNNKWCFESFKHEKKAIIKAINLHKKAFDVKERLKLIKLCKSTCNYNSCLLRRRIKKNKIIINKTPLCKLRYCPEHKVFRNLCTVCKTDMGPTNPRQLCRKLYCPDEYNNYNNNNHNNNNVQSEFKYEKDALYFVLDSPDAEFPTKATPKAAGYDLYASEAIDIPAGERKVIDTGIKVKFPENHYGRISSRSSLAAKNWIDVKAGIIDEDYTGTLRVVLANNSKSIYPIRRRDKIAQLICQKYHDTPANKMNQRHFEIITKNSQRKTMGFGSSDFS